MKNRKIYKHIGVLALTSVVTLNSSLSALASITETPQPPAVNRSIVSFDENIDLSKYTIADLNQLSYDELVHFLTNISYLRHSEDEKVRKSLEKFMNKFGYLNDDTRAFHSDEKRIDAIIQAIIDQAPTITPEDNKGILTFFKILGLRYYLGFEYDEVSHFFNYDAKERTVPAILAVQRSPHYRLGTDSQDKLVLAVTKFAYSTGANAEMINNNAIIMEDFYKNKENYLTKWRKRDSVYHIIKTTNNVLYYYQNSIGESFDKLSTSQPVKSKLHGKIDRYLDILAKYGFIGELGTDNEFLSDNALFYLVNIVPLHSSPDELNPTFTEASEIYPTSTVMYSSSIKAITKHFNGYDANGRYKHSGFLKNQLTKELLPETYSFDNGKFIVKAGDKIPEEKIQRLYWAAKEVQAQYFRTLGRDEALEKGHADDVLTCWVYNTKTDYNNNKFINGINTNNGGMYIEKDGTFYTFERPTKYANSLTLEELFRHEFVHYLQGRYSVPGYWGSKIYSDNKLAWFEEGDAEYFTGSTRTTVLPRRNQYKSYGFDRDPRKRYSTKDLIGKADYSGSFYNYSSAFNTYLHEKHKDIYYKIQDFLYNYDVEGYTNYLEEIKKDKNLNYGYQRHMQKYYRIREKLAKPLASDDYLATIDAIDAQEVYTTLEKVASLTDVQVEEMRGELLNSFTLRGTFTGDASQGERKDQQKMTDLVNGYLKTLDSHAWNGYKTLTAYFVNYRTDDAGRAQYDVVFHGYLTKELENKAPVVNIDGPYSAVTNKSFNFSSKGSFDADGVIDSYQWDFGDGTTSNFANPHHVYTESGTYPVSLTITDSDGVTKTTDIQMTVEDYLINESEPNNRIDNANSPIYHNKPVSGLIGNGDNYDKFTFTVTRPGKVDTSLTYSGDSKVRLYITKKYGTNKNYASSKHVEGKTISNAYLEPGEYVVSLTAPGAPEAIPYSLKLSGPITGNSATSIVELEPLDDMVVDHDAPQGLPKSVTALMNDGSKEELLIAWDQELDTSVPGEYIFTGKVFDDSFSVSLKVTVLEYITKENEKNSKFEDANGPIFHNISVPASITKDRDNNNYSYDYVDSFYFNVVRPGAVTIKIDHDTPADMDVLLFHESNLDKRIAKFGRKDPLNTTQVLTPGKYYIRVFAMTDKYTPYSINIQGSIEGSEDSAVIGIEENTAMEVAYDATFKLPDTIQAKLDNGSTRSLPVVWDGTVDTTKPGTYDYEGTILGTDFTFTYTVTVLDKVKVTTGDSIEIKPNTNNTNASANKKPGKSAKDAAPLYKEKSVSSSLGKGNLKEVFYIDVVEPGDVSITVDGLSDTVKASNFNWTLRKEGESSFTTWAKSEDNQLTNSFNADAGRYYLVVYTFNGSASSYNVTVEGSIASDPNAVTEPAPEKVYNNTFKTATAIQLPLSTQSVDMVARDMKDVYYFEIAEEKEIEINVTPTTATVKDMNWILFNAEDTKTYVTWAKKEENSLKKTYLIEPGKYYLDVYKFDKIDCSYDLTITEK